MKGFNELDSLSTELVNCLSVDTETKELLRKNILHLVIVSCKSYEQNPSFKKEIEMLESYLQSQK